MILSDKFARRYIVRIVGIVAALCLLYLNLWNPDLINNLRLKVYDLLVRANPAPIAAQPIVIVDVDEKSLTELGQWPWPRSLWSEIVRRIGLQSPRVIGFDIVFAEPDRSSPGQLLGAFDDYHISEACRAELARLPDHDLLLANALFDTPTVLGFPFIFSQSATINPPIIRRANRFIVCGSSNSGGWLFPAGAAVFNLKGLEASAIGSGFFNVLPDDDGSIRRVPLALQFGDTIYPSLALEMLRIGEKVPINQLHITNNGVEGVSCGPYDIPTDAHAQINVHYRGAEKSFTYISALDIVKGTIDEKIFTDAYVLIGTSAAGLVDIVTTPTSTLFPGVEVHANILNSILTASWIREPDWAKGAEFCYLIVVSIILIVLVPAVGALGGGIVLFVGAVLIVGFSLWLFNSYGYFFDPVYPLLSSTVLFSLLSFMNYFLEERIRRQTRNTFSKYVSPEVVAELLKRPGEVNLKGEERVLTALFSDIRGFSRISEILTPEEICSSLNQYLTVMTRIIRGNRGTVDKFIGDAVFAFWNAPLDDEEHARHALAAAISMRAGLRDLNRNWQMNNMQVFEAGIGIHTGPVRVGNIGSEDRLSYTAIGDNINLASRLEGVTKYYGIPTVISGTTREMVDDEEFMLCKLDRIQVVGRDEPVEIFALVDYKNRVANPLKQAIRAYEEALELYFSGNFILAGEKFSRLPEFISGKLQKLFIERCQDYSVNHPGSEWTGVYVMKSK